MKVRPRIPWIGWAALATSRGCIYNPDPEADDGDPPPGAPCRCGARIGGYHLAVDGHYCDLEWCSLCGGQLLSCYCDHAQPDELGVHLLVPETAEEREIFGALSVCIAPTDVDVRKDRRMAGFVTIGWDLEQLREVISIMQQAERAAS